MIKKYVLIIVLFIVTFISFGQPFEILCSKQKIDIKIENSNDIPTVVENDDGTVMLTQFDNNITNIFANYTIYDFYQSFPDVNPDSELFKYYALVYKNKDLINELYDYSNPNTFEFNRYEFTPISTEIINLLDGKTYNLIKQCFESDEIGMSCPQDEVDVPTDFELKIAFNYDATLDIMYAGTVGFSACGNSFSIGLKGGTEDGFGSSTNTLQLWESELGTATASNFDESCHNLESIIYSIFDIACNPSNYGNITVIDQDGQFILGRENFIFARDFLTFEESNLSIEENTFFTLLPFETKSNPYLQILNGENQSFYISIFNLSGQKLLNNITFETNTIDISNFSKGLYLIKLSNSQNQQKVFKFLKN